MEMGQASEVHSGGVQEQEATVEHPEKLVNETPELLVNGYNLVTEIIVAYGWYIVFAIVILYYLKHRFNSQISQLMKEKSDRDYYKKYDTKTTLARQEGRERALKKMQEESDIRAREHLEKQQEKEEQKRLQRVEEWENHKQGKSYRSKLYKPKEEETTTEATPKKPKPTKTFRPNDYNPLMGGGGGGGFRPRQRSSRGG